MSLTLPLMTLLKAFAAVPARYSAFIVQTIDGMIEVRNSSS